MIAKLLIVAILVTVSNGLNNGLGLTPQMGKILKKIGPVRQIIVFFV